LLSNKEVAGLVIAHTLGFPFAADLIAESIFSDQFFIEDCSDALGTKIKGFHVGSFADVSTFSFFPAHHITTGEGGAVGTNSGEMYRILESYNNWGRDCWCKPGESNTCNRRFSHHEYRLPYGYDHKYTFSRTGYNLKMTEFQAALGYSQLQRLDIIVESRLNNFNYLASALDYYEELDLIEWNYYLGNPSPFGFPIIVNEKANFTRKELVQFLESNGVRTRPLFAGNITRQPFMKNVNYATAGSLENSDYIMNNAFWIGCHDSLTKEQLDYTLEIFELFFKHREILN
jgi:CDP-6-deoxy-D-xylo-4-hexulose-3-dehydrase